MPSLLKRKRKRAVASRTAHLHGSPKLASSSSSSSHYDPHISQEDEEIRRLERLLKVDALGGRQKLRKELGELDGLGEDLDAFLDSLGGSNSDGKSIDDHGEDPETGDENIRHHALYGLPSDEEDIVENGSEKNLSPSESDKESLDEDQRGPTYRPSAGQDIYGRSKGVDDKAAAYVPPHLRGLKIGENGAGKIKIFGTAEVPGPLSRDLVRRLNGQLNRLSEDSLDPVLFEIGRLYDDYSTSVVNDELFSAMRTVCVHPTQTMSTLIPCYAALIAGLHVTRGAEVGGRALETVGQEFSASLKDEIPRNKCVVNLGLILGYLYVLGVAHRELIFDILHILSERCAMSDLELLPPFLHLCSNRLRKDDATAFRAELTHVRSNAEKQISASATKEDNPAGTEHRARLVLDACVECKSKTTRKAMLGSKERVLSLRKWLGKVRSSNSGSAAVPLRISWEDLTCANLRGRWWLVGAAWSGGGGGERVTSLSQDGDDGRTSSERRHEGKNEEMVVNGCPTIPNGLSPLAAMLSMNTDTRKQIFYALMSSADFENAADGILRLNLRNKSQREISRVILICCCKESTYNPFYAYVGAILCEQQANFKFSFQLALWDTFLKLKDFTPREANNLGRFVSHLILHRHLSIGVLKAIDTKDTSSRRVALFLRVIFLNVFSEPDEGKFLELFKRLQDEPRKQQHSNAATTNGTDESEEETSGTEEQQSSSTHPGRATIRHKILLLVLTYAANPPAGLSKDERKAYRKRVEAVMKTLQ